VHRAARPQAGFSLVEVVIAVALTGLVVLALAYAMVTLVTTNRQASEAQQVDQALGGFSENLKAAEYLRCAGPADYRDLLDTWSEAWQAPRDAMTAEVVAVNHWDASTDDFTGGCAAEADDAGAQRLTLRVQWRDLERSTQIVKRDR